MILNLMKDELKRDEGVKLEPYRCTAGKLTIGCGRNLSDNGITEAEADYLLTNDISNAINGLDMALPFWKDMSEVRQRALLNMSFNMGLHRLMGFKNMLAALKNKDYTTASAEALDSDWSRQVGSRAQRIAVQLATG